MYQKVVESGVIILGVKTSSPDFATSLIGEALTAKTKKKRVVKKDTNDIVMAVNVERRSTEGGGSWNVLVSVNFSLNTSRIENSGSFCKHG